MKGFAGRVALLVKLACLLGIIIVILNYFDIYLIIASFDAKIFVGILVSQVLSIAAIIVSSFRYAILVRNPPIPLKIACKAVLLSYGLNLLFPARASELLRPIYLNKNLAIPISNSLSALFVEHLIDVIFLCMLTILGAGILFFRFNNSIYLFVVVVVLLFLLIPLAEKTLVAKLSRIRINLLAQFLQKCVSHLAKCIREGVLLKAFAVGSLGWLFSFAMVICFLNIAGPFPIDAKGSFLVFLAIMAGGAIPALPGGIGTYEGAAVWALTKLGYGINEALVLAISLHICQMFFPLVSALFIIFTDRIGISDLLAQLEATFRHKED